MPMPFETRSLDRYYPSAAPEKPQVEALPKTAPSAPSGTADKEKQHRQGGRGQPRHRREPQHPRASLCKCLYGKDQEGARLHRGDNHSCAWHFPWDPQFSPGSPPLTQLCIRQLRLKWGERYIQTVGPQGYAHLGCREQGGKSKPVARPPLLLGQGQAHGCVGSTPLLAPSLHPEATGRPGPITVKPLQVSPCTLSDTWLLPGHMKAPISFFLA